MRIVCLVCSDVKRSKHASGLGGINAADPFGSTLMWKLLPRWSVRVGHADMGTERTTVGLIVKTVHVERFRDVGLLFCVPGAGSSLGKNRC